MSQYKTKKIICLNYELSGSLSRLYWVGNKHEKQCPLKKENKKFLEERLVIWNNSWYKLQRSIKITDKIQKLEREGAASI